MKSIKKYILVGLLVFSLVNKGFAQLFDKEHQFTKGDSLRGNLSVFRSCFDVYYYDLKVKVDVTNKSIEGSNDIYYKVLSDFNTIQIDLFSNLAISHIYFGNQELTFNREYDAVFVHFPTKQLKGTKGIISVEYSGKPQIAKNAPWDGGFSWTTDEKGNPFVGVSCEGLGASVWWPNKDHLSDEPDSMSIRGIVPEGLDCIANGNLRAEKSISGGYKEFDWFVSYPINNYNVTLNIGKYAHFSDTYISADGEKLALDYYVLAYNESIAKKQFEQVKPMLACYEKNLGKYPFYKDGYALIETPYLGMEHQSGIAYGNKYKTGYLGYDFSGIGLDFDYIIIHESGHEWWGNNVSCKDIADMWIHEGICTYCESMYVECQYDAATALNYMNAMKSKVGNDAPIIGRYNVNEEGSGDMYAKGALMMHTLRTLTNNDSLWWSIIKGIQTDFALQTVTSSQIEKYISNKAGKDFSKEFDLYLRQIKLPMLEYALTPTADGLEFSYRWVTPDKAYEMPMRFKNAKGELEWIEPTYNWQTQLIKGVSLTQFKLDDEHFYFDSRMVKSPQQ